ncbi:MAG: helix-turn-helix domain-containing protein [Chitinophagaceae bacterium]
MKQLKLKKKKIESKSRAPYKRRDDSEIIKIVREVQSGMIGIRAACKKYGLCRATLRLWITRLSVRNLGDELSNQLLSSMTGDQKNKALEKKVKELTKALELARLKTDSLETMIKVAEEDLHIKIRKKRGTKQSRE